MQQMLDRQSDNSCARRGPNAPRAGKAGLPKLLGIAAPCYERRRQLCVGSRKGGVKVIHGRNTFHY